MNSRFNKFFELLIKFEGGYVNHPNDTGGATKYGITQSVFEQFYKRSDVENITKQQAKTIYYSNYYIPLKLDEVKSERIAQIIFDFAVNSGVKRSAYVLQDCIIKAGGNIASDGIVGEKTLHALNNLVDNNAVYKCIFDARYNYYHFLAGEPVSPEYDAYFRGKLRAKPSKTQSVFLKGWLSRINHFNTTSVIISYVSILAILSLAYYIKRKLQ